jgi:hypothetical protein
MAWSFGDSFDLYTAGADAATYWDTATGTLSLAAGRFGGQALQIGSGAPTLVKSSGVNDAVHHIACSFQQTATITGTTLGTTLQLLDGTTAQCSIVFRSDGTILLASGIATGTVLATYAGAFPLQNTWYHFEFEVVINNTTGSFKVRKNGNSVDDHSATGLNTRGGTANNYANKLSISRNLTVSFHLVDDMFWRSDASSGTWLGELRCYTRMPASDASVAWARLSGATNFSNVDEATQNALTDYVYSSTVGQEDFYGVASIASTPMAVIATTTRAYMQKSDAGARTAAVQLKSGSTTVTSSTVSLVTTWAWAWRMDLTDPATGTAWTPAAVSAATIGPKVIA